MDPLTTNTDNYTPQPVYEQPAFPPPTPQPVVQGAITYREVPLSPTAPPPVKPAHRVKDPAGDTSFASASLTLGLLAVLTFGFFINVLFAILSVIFGILHLAQKHTAGNGRAIAGLLASAASILMMVALLVSLQGAIDAAGYDSITNIFEFYVDFLLYGYFH